MARYLLPLGGVFATLAASGCVVNASAPITANTDINANAQVQANTQVDQRQGEFAQGSGQQQTGQASQGASNSMPETSPASQQSPGPAVTPAQEKSLTFATVKSFKQYSTTRVLDFKNVFVIEGMSLYFTNDAGATWKKSDPIGTKNLKSVYFLNANEGWVGGDNGVLFKVTIKDGKATTQLFDSGTNERVDDILFTDSNTGYIIHDSSINRTTDGGETWDEALRFPGPGAPKFSKDASGNVYVSGYSTSSGYTFPGYSFKYVAGGLVPLGVDGDYSFGILEVAGNTAYISRQEYYYYSLDSLWYAIGADGSQRKIGPDAKTPTQILRPVGSQALTMLFPIDDSRLMAYLPSKQIITSSDGGKSWTDPIKTNLFNNSHYNVYRSGRDSLWLKPFSETQVWAWNGDTLFRAGL